MSRDVRGWLQRPSTITFVLAGLGAYVTLFPPSNGLVKIALVVVFVLLSLATTLASERADVAAETRAQQQFDRLYSTLRDTVPNDHSLKHRAVRTVQAIAQFLRDRSHYEKTVIEPEIFRVSAEAVQTKNSVRFMALAHEVKNYYDETLRLYHQRWGKTTSSLLEELYSVGLVSREDIAAAKSADAHELWAKVVVVIARASELLPEESVTPNSQSTTPASNRQSGAGPT